MTAHAPAHRLAIHTDWYHPRTRRFVRPDIVVSRALTAASRRHLLHALVLWIAATGGLVAAFA